MRFVWRSSGCQTMEVEGEAEEGDDDTDDGASDEGQRRAVEERREGAREGVESQDAGEGGGGCPRTHPTVPRFLTMSNLVMTKMIPPKGGGSSDECQHTADQTCHVTPGRGVGG